MLTPRRRIVLALFVTWPLAVVWVGWIVLTVYSLLEFERSRYTSCGGGFIEQYNLPGFFDGCNGYFSWPVAVVELLFLLAVTVAVAIGVSRWALAPVGQLADTVERLGPTSLGLRLRRGGPADETRRLADGVDAMLDRVAEGYETQRRFAANASHELRTPLATQRALIEISLSNALTPEQLELVARQLLATNERNERLIDGLLTLAETERGLMANAAQPFDRIVCDAVDTLRPRAAEQGLDVTAEVVPVVVRGELPLLDRLVANLVQNAIKYNVTEGWVRVELRADGVLTVSNSGPAVPPEQVAGLFEPFRRMSGERLEHGGGVGLGLTIARSIVAEHHGEITATANPQGGLTVAVRLPVDA
ncbi:HAMP domain-containing sensor histidine kinase [Jatrophihabitans endophyticus]|uniref:sensor histidine kinase n=1 Tax=Jatrophihabitans endophyticus TaxID=1206085 RepID=UPI0019D8B45F|nr:HAMP domain-containing sensor histidine kinase [Jatrophihabitans endophyticus]MBE7190084.1 HAMP domain-containing histidine kinase [Jatrophihabitans endophyticus]